MKECVLCGIDSSTNKTGFSIFINGKFNTYDLIDLSNEKDKSNNLFKMSKQILNKLDIYKPHIVVCELTSMTRNAVTQRTLTIVLGVIYCWCVQNDCECVFLRASEWRKLISDEKKPRKRNELKQWAINKCKEIYKIEVTDDIAEAILIGQARINQFKEK